MSGPIQDYAVAAHPPYAAIRFRQTAVAQYVGLSQFELIKR